MPFHGYRISREPPHIVVLDRADPDLAKQGSIRYGYPSSGVPPPAYMILPAIWVVLGGFDPLRSLSLLFLLAYWIHSGNQHDCII
jgi:hypothetical protein